MFKKWIALLLWAVPFICAAQNIDLLILNKNYNEALLQINKNLRDLPEAELYFKQGIIYRQLSEPLNAERSFKNSVSLDSTDSKYLAEYADLQVDIGNPFKAINLYQRAIHYSPEDFNLKYKLGKAFISAEDYQKAYDIFMMIRYKDSTNVVYNKQLGLMALRTGKIKQAIELFESVLEYNPNDFSTYVNLISLYLKNKNAVHIVRTSDRALYFFPDNPAILLREANSLYVLKEYEEAIPPFVSYLAQSDSVFDVLENYGISLYFIQDDINARKILEKCFTLNPTDQFVNFYLGLICKRLNDFPKSVEYLKMAIAAAQPAYLTEMYHLLGQIFGLQREFEKSIESLLEAYKCNPLKNEVLVEIAKTYEEFNPDKKLALNYYSQYLKEAGDSAVNSGYAQDRINKIKWETYHKKTNKNPK